MVSIRPIRIGLALGAVLALMHALWAGIVAAGFAQRLLDYIFWLHFIQPVYVILPFNIGTAVALVSMVAVCGFVIGTVFAWLWNRLAAH